MKKFYSLILLAIAAMSANAQVVLTYGGQTVDASQTLVVKASETVYDLGDGEFWTIVESGTTDPVIVNQGSSDAAYSVTVTTENPSVFQWCGVTGQCMKLSQTTTTRSGALAAGKSGPLQLEAEYEGGEYATYAATVAITSGGKTTTYTLSFVYDETCSAGIHSLTTTHSNSAVYDLTGRIINQPISGNIYIQNGRKYIQK